MDDRFAAALRGFGPIGLAAILAVVAGNLIVAPLGAVIVVAWAIRSRTPWSELGFTTPRVTSLAAAAALGASFKVVMKAVIMPLLGAPPVNAAYHYLAGNSAALPGILFAVIVNAGIGEEIVFRSFAFERLGKLVGRGPPGRALTVLVTSALFAAAHFADQGLPGVEQAAFTGLAFGTAYAVLGCIWPVMVGHAAFDVVAVAMIYFDVEPRFAHFFFK